MRKLIPIALAMATLAGCATTMVPVGANRDVAGATAVEITVGQEFPTFHRRDPYLSKRRMLPSSPTLANADGGPRPRT